LQAALADLPPEAAAHPAIQRVAAQIALPYEYRAARDYCRDNGARCLPLDLGELSRRHLPRYGPEFLTPENLKALLATEVEPLENYAAGEFRRARSALEQAPWRPPLPGSKETWRREFFISRRLQRLLGKGERIVHLGGWEHLVPWRDCEGLRSRLEEQKPYILLADEGDF
jgi:hypothetical protein